MLLPLFIGIDGIWLAVVVSETMALAFPVIFFIRMKQQYQYA